MLTRPHKLSWELTVLSGQMTRAQNREFEPQRRRIARWNTPTSHLWRALHSQQCSGTIPPSWSSERRSLYPPLTCKFSEKHKVSLGTCSPAADHLQVLSFGVQSSRCCAHALGCPQCWQLLPERQHARGPNLLGKAGNQSDRY